MNARLARHPLTPWAGLLVGALAWFAHQQIATALINANCQLGGPALTVGLGLVCGLITAGAGLLSWQVHRVQRDASQETPHNRSVAGMIGAGSAGVFVLTIVFQSLTGILLPACQR